MAGVRIGRFAPHGAATPEISTPNDGSKSVLTPGQNQADFPVVLGNLFHPQNPQQAKYTTAENHLKGLQTAGGNKVLMSDNQGQQTILLSNSNNKGTAVFKVGDKLTFPAHLKVRQGASAHWRATQAALPSGLPGDTPATCAAWGGGQGAGTGDGKICYREG